MDGRVESLPESKLGTKEHWDQVYEFGEDSVERMIRYLVDMLQEKSDEEAKYILDVGTGNGHLLFALMDAQLDEAENMTPDIIFPARLCGIDYSAASIELSKAIGSKRGHGCEQILFLECDLRNMPEMDELAARPSHGKGWDIVCDKGTIALSSQLVHGKLPVDLYVEAVHRLTRKDGGIFFITSCNFTQEELATKFQPAGFLIEHVVPTPSFTFVCLCLFHTHTQTFPLIHEQGGQQGSTVTTVAFRRG
ncbi:hypothetical protein MGL_3167 [Malassezia globosa CBS 7966]|uniref:Protein-lysine N-methyltransferase EFM4 n=1 Tax=Malassezia globosa (strain ATCC MYA-4612 / CBS 7966) TaxID=425265 RepID=A8Q7Z6_MALGO|nr:uncharacterized protein MGL_3167 [Malassezia globosa CBS 7966]EDP42409.1 hypothetical protein MGL_3167 [Malassezia globosa CBS 7966]